VAEVFGKKTYLEAYWRVEPVNNVYVEEVPACRATAAADVSWHLVVMMCTYLFLYVLL
jgi:hypothetical protein